MMNTSVVICVVVMVVIVVLLAMAFIDQCSSDDIPTEVNGSITELLARKKNLLDTLSMWKDSYDSGTDNNSSVPIIYINLGRSRKRKVHIEKQLDSLGWKYERQEAVDGKCMYEMPSTVESEFNTLGYAMENGDTLIVDTNSKEHSPGEMGCTCSHILAIKRAYDRNYPAAFILEDDSSLATVPYWGVKIEKLIESLPTNWGILAVGSHDYDSKIPSAISKRDIHRYNANCWGTVGYLISRKGMRDVLSKVLDNSESNNKDIKLILDKNMGSDKSISSDQLIYFLSLSYIHLPPLIITGNNEDLSSTIHESHDVLHLRDSINDLESYFR